MMLRNERQGERLGLRGLALPECPQACLRSRTVKRFRSSDCRSNVVRRPFPKTATST
jgi:hypothetical protein